MCRNRVDGHDPPSATADCLAVGPGLRRGDDRCASPFAATPIEASHRRRPVPTAKYPVLAMAGTLPPCAKDAGYPACQ